MRPHSLRMHACHAQAFLSALTQEPVQYTGTVTQILEGWSQDAEGVDVAVPWCVCVCA
jgi:hypothetical protein